MFFLGQLVAGIKSVPSKFVAFFVSFYLLFRLSLTSFRRRKLRNLTAILGIALGVTLAAGIQISVDSSTAGLNFFFGLRYGNVDQQLSSPISSGYTQDQVDEIYESLSKVESVIAKSARFTVTASIQTLDGSIENRQTILGISPQESGFGNFYLDGADMIFNLSDLGASEVIIGEDLAIALGAMKGDTLVISPQFNQFAYNGNVTIKGIVEPDIISDTDLKNRELDGFFIATSIENVWNWLGVSEIYTDIIINFDDIHATEEELEEQADLAFQQIITDNPSLESNLVSFEGRKSGLALSEVLNSSLQQTEWTFGLLIIFAAILVIINIQALSFEEREKNTAILRAVGSNRGQVVLYYLIESLFTGIAGAILGFSIGIGYALFLLWSLGFAFGYDGLAVGLTIRPFALFLSVGAGIGLSLFTAILPAINASRVNVVNILRNVKSSDAVKRSVISLPIGVVLFIWGLYIFVSIDPNPLSAGTDSFRDTSVTLAFLISGLVTIVGISFVTMFLTNRIKALLTFSILNLIWALIHILFIITYIREGNDGLLYIIGLMFSLLISSIILVGINLQSIAVLFERISYRFQIFGKSTQTIFMVALRHMASTRLRTTLTFSLFAAILTLNVFLASWSNSFRYGLGDLFESYSSDSELLVYPTSNINSSIGFADLISDDPEFGDKIVDSLSLTYNKGPAYLNTSSNSLLSSVYHVGVDPDDFFNSSGGWKFRTDLLDAKATEFETGEFPNAEQTPEDEVVWKALADDKPYNSTHPYPVLIASPIFNFISFGNIEELKVPGDLLYLPLTNGSLQPFILGGTVETSVITETFSNFEAFAGPPIAFTFFVNSKYMTDLVAFQSVLNTENFFLFDTIYDLTDEENVELAILIEVKTNNLNGEFTREVGSFGITSITSYSVFELQLEGFSRFLLFLQLFTTLGFLMGILGLLVISLRSVAERRREIGMLRAIGMSRRSVLISVVLELMFIGLIGAVLGIVNGNLLAYALLRVISGSNSFIIPWVPLLVYVSITFVATMIAAGIPGYLAARIPPSQALRYIG